MNLFEKELARFPAAEVYELAGHKIFLQLEPLKLYDPAKSYLFPYPKGGVFVEGKDAKTFLQGMLTGDVLSLTAELLRSLVVSHQGRILFDVVLKKTAEDRYQVFVEPGEENKLLDLFSYYHVIEEVEFRLAPPSYLFLLFVPERRGAELTLENQNQTSVPTKSFGQFFEEQDLASLKQQFSLCWIGMEALEQLRPYFYWPRSGVDFDSSNYPLEVGLSYLVDYLKGCYVGQEPVARMFHKGKATKSLFLLKSSQPLSRSERIFLETEPVGLVTSPSSLEIEGGFFSLASIKTRVFDSALDQAALQTEQKLSFSSEPLEDKVFQTGGYKK